MTHEEALLVAKAFAIAAGAHADQVSRDGTAYILHPIRMAVRCEDADGQMAAVLHDVVEDTPITLADLADAGIPAQVLTAVESLTKREGEPYEAFIERASRNPLAARVKLLDLEDNLNPMRLCALDDEDLQRIAKYHRAWNRLREMMGREVSQC
ncbi:hypothetical protein CCAX7_53590 [Capsulimonas corticalis]|uniref:Uncharacterized protein n=1 Tax=Capsulimonas corticalis TaxID=2219043 RepID=A0A402CNT8_9BACT|nr:HD domain-containing protein [Capsulimonas corticalis]BDI33308.1 hypothetical protein CCAX7_53590 [Capsulimonas corticalis]